MEVTVSKLDAVTEGFLIRSSKLRLKLLGVL